MTGLLNSTMTNDGENNDKEPNFNTPNANQATLNGLNKLQRVSLRLESSDLYYCVIGGFAVDGYAGKLTRNHGDLDMLCFREDFDKIRMIIGSEFKDLPLKNENRPYKFYTNDESLTFHIIDNDSLHRSSIGFWCIGRVWQPTIFFDRTQVSIDEVLFHALNKSSMVYLKEEQRDFEKKMINDPLHKNKYESAVHDLKILTNC